MEIERKFIVNVDKLLFNLNDYERQKLEQAYISTDDTEVRIRKIKNNYGENKCYMTVKSSGDLKREEIEFEIPYSKYRDLIGNKMYKGTIIDKLRYKIPLEQGIIAELDVYGRALFGLVVVEVEFESVEQSKQFRQPSWFGEEITNDKKYKNKNLALS